MSERNESGEILIRLAEMAKNGNLADPGLISHFLEESELPVTGVPEHDFFRALSAQLMVEKGATIPPTVPIISISAPATEDLSICNSDLLPLVKECLQYKDWTILEEILRILISQKKLMHPSVVPLLLDQTEDLYHLHPLLYSTLGKRACWLSALRPAWRWYEEMQLDTFENVQQDYQLVWMLFQLKNDRKTLLQGLSTMSEKDRLPVLESLGANPLPHHEPIARHFLHSRSSKERYWAGLILLKLDTPERTNTSGQLRQYFEEHLVNQENQWSIALPKSPEKIFDNAIVKILSENKDKSNPFLEIAGLFPPEIMLDHLDLPQREIIEKLATEKKLLDLYQTILNSASIFPTNSNWAENLILDWIKSYPEGNRAKVSLINLLGKLPYDKIQNTIRLVLQSDHSYFLEKLNVLVTGIDHYIKKDLSEALIEKVFLHLDHRLSRLDIQHLITALPHLQYLLDPRAYHSVVNRWREADYHQQKLVDVLWEFRTIMKQRQQILTTIIN